MNVLQVNKTTSPDNADVGGKCSSLIQLQQQGMNVPNSFVLTTSAYANHAMQCRLNERIMPLIEKQNWEGVELAAKEIFDHCQLNEDFVSRILEQYDQMKCSLVAVRSSATCEDQGEASSAGQYETYLNIEGKDALLQAIKNCWASLWSRRALIYRHRQAIKHFPAQMAVIIQEMVTADAAGVLFTQDPLKQYENHIRIEIIPGLGEALVSGEVTGEIYRVDKTSLTEIGKKNSSGLLSSKILTELCGMANQLEDYFGVPQDIEFATKQDRIHFLQSRPMTALERTTIEPIEPLGKLSTIEKMIKPFADERYVIAPRPLDNIVVRLLLGAHIHSIRETGAIIKEEVEKTLLNQIWRQAYRIPPVNQQWKMYVLGVPLIFKNLKTDWLNWWDTGPAEELKTVSGSVNLSLMKEEELFSQIDQILAIWKTHMYKRINAAGGIHAEPLLRLLIKLAVGSNRSNQVMGDLMAGINTPTINLNEELWNLSRLARQNPEVLIAVREVKPERLEETETGRQFIEAFTSFVDEHGHREGSCWYITTPTWRQDQKQVWRLLSSLVDAESRTGDPEQARTRHQEALALVEKRLRYMPGLRHAFRSLWHKLYRLNTFREKSHYDLTRPLDALQGIFHELGRRLTNRGILGRETDTGYLTYEEIRDWLCNSPPKLNTIQKLLINRQATYRLVNDNWQAERACISAKTGKNIKGLAASPGITRGRVRVIRGEHEFGKLLAGEVLVCPYTNPAWTPLFATAKAVVTETGGLASHAAIVAREYGIPVVMAIPGATCTLNDGQEIQVDGNRGIISL